MSESLTIQDLVAELREMAALGRQHQTLARRLLGQNLRIRYELLPAAGEPPVPYLMTVTAERSAVEPADPPYDDVDIVVRATPETMHRVINGGLGGREAMVSGLLELRKAPSMPKLLLMKGLFNRYKKARARGELVPAAPPPPRSETDPEG